MKRFLTAKLLSILVFLFVFTLISLADSSRGKEFRGDFFTYKILTTPTIPGVNQIPSGFEGTYMTSTGMHYKNHTGTVVDILDAANSLELTAGGDQAANKFVGGPTSGGDATPTFRLLVKADIPATVWSTPNAIGSTTPAAGSFTTIGASGQVTSTVTTGTAPMVIASTTKVSNLNADTLDGNDWVAPGTIGATTPGIVHTLVHDDAVVALTPASTISLDPTLGGCFTLTPGETETINAASVPARHQTITIVITTSGSSSYTLTFGTNFKSTGTLATGVTTAKVFTIKFESDGVNFNEVSRTTAM